MFTENGARTNKSSGKACLDLFAIIGAARRHPGQLVTLFTRAHLEDRALALRILLWARDARGGAGEREAFRNILHWLERHDSEAARLLVQSGKVPEMGRWDDLLGVATPAMRALVAEQVGEALKAGNRLAAKWMPRRGPVAAWLRKELGLTEGLWRKVLVSQSDTVKQVMARGDWTGIRYSAVPSVAAARYQGAFSRHDSKYALYLEDVLEGRATMHAGAVFPHDVAKAALTNDAAATAQWSQLPRPAVQGKALVLCDVSGSMTSTRISGSTTPLDVAISLSLLLAESLPEPFRNRVLTFTDVPHFHEVRGETLLARYQSLLSADWGMTTNIQAAFDAVLAQAKKAESGFAMPEALIVLSDMEFNVADRKGLTNHEAMKRKFEAAGIRMPTLVYWNLNGRAGNLPAKGQDAGVVLVSGFSPKIVETILAGDFQALTPEALMHAAVSVPRYAIPGLTDGL